MSLEANNSAANVRVTYNELNRSELESIPAKSPHRKYLILLALHLLHTDDPLLLSEAADCSERTFHYVKKRLSEEDHNQVLYLRC